jgi:hypothetical protein
MGQLASKRNRSKRPASVKRKPRMIESFSSRSFMVHIAFGSVKELEELYQQ